MPRRRWPIAALLLGSALLPASGAQAALGGALASVEADRSAMAARMASTDVGDYARHVLTRANGGTVHELTNANGEVFAVSWAGPGKPDLRALLGSRFAAFQSASKAGAGQAMHALRRPIQVERPDLEIQTEGHMGWFRGVAFVRSLAPAGFSTGDLAPR